MRADAGPPMIVIFARVPEPGRSKTRLIPRLGDEGAAALGAAMAEDVIAEVQRLDVPARIVLAGPLDHPWARSLPLPVEAQAEGDLGVRLAVALRDGGVAVGSDAPTLPASLLVAALDAVARGEVVFGPAFDGGYTLVGTPDPAGLFDQIPWSTAETYAASYTRAVGLGRRVTVLPFWYDVDEPADLDRLRLHLRTLPLPVAPATRRALDTLPPFSS